MFGNSAFGKPAGASPFGTFGQTNANTQPQAQPANTGTTNTASPFGAFGNTNANQNQPNQQQPVGANAAPNPLFGGRPTTSLFGNTATSTQPATGTPLFGGGNTFGAGTANQQQQQQQQQQQPGTNIFGSSAAAPSTSTGLFGASTTGVPSSQSVPSTGIFGQPQTQNQAQPSTGLFGQQQTQPQASTSAPSLFGQPQNQAQAQPQLGSSIFGQPAQSQPQAQTGSSIFGSLGQSTAQTTPSGGLGLFGGTQIGSSILGSTSGNLGSSSIFAPKSSLLQPSREDSAQAQYANLVQRIEAIYQAWDPNSPQNRFQYFFYNLVDPSQVHMYGRPQNATNDALWQKAIRENPDPSCYVPALAVGFDDVQKRVEAQKQQATAQQEKLKELKSRIAALASSHSTTNAPRLQRALAVQTQLQQRLVRLVQHLHLLIPSIRSSSIRPEEDVLRSELESLEEEIMRPGGSSRLKGKLNELWAIIGSVEASRELERKNGENGVEWTVVDPEGMQKLTHILLEQQNGIAHLTKIVEGHQKDLDVILGKPTQEREPDAFSTAQSSQVLLGASTRRY